MSCVIVLGCFRSGTSAVAGVLHKLGVAMGTEFDPPSRANPTGYWEDLEFKRLHHRIDDAKGLTPDIEAEYRALVKKREEQPIWGLKDPKLCLYLPVLTDALTTDHRLIVVDRPRDEISGSFNRAMGTPDLWSPLVDFYLKAKEKQLTTYSGPVLRIEFGDLLKEKTPTISRIAEFVGVSSTMDAIDFVSG